MVYLIERSRLALSLVCCLVLGLASPSVAGPYVTEASGVRWNDVGGVRWNDVGGVRWNDVGGVRWNDVGGVRWNDVGGVLITDASGVRWNDVGGVRWNDVGSIVFDDAIETGVVSIDLDLLNAFSTLPDTSAINVIVTYRQAPTQADLDQLLLLGIPGGTLFRRLPMVVVNATKQQIQSIAQLPAVRSVYSNKTLSFFDDESNAQIGLGEVVQDDELQSPGGGTLTGAGVTVAVLDSGIDAGHADLGLGTKVVENVVLVAAPPGGIGFSNPAFVEGQTDTDPSLGHGTFVASVAAGSGQASGGLYAGVAPGASVLGLSAGNAFILNVLEGFDYVLENRDRFGIRVLNCSWGTQGWFDPDDPVNIATRAVHDAGVTVVFAAGNHGPSPDSLNPYAVAPWVIGVGSVRGDGSLSSFSSRGIFEELIYHPTLVAPGEGIIGARAGLIADVDGIAGVADPAAGEAVPPQYADDYVVSSGTSFAAPHVAGVIALMLEAEPALTPVEIKRRLQQTSIPLPALTRSEVGAGALDAWAAVTSSVDAGRPFGTHYPGWLDQRPFEISHQPAVETNPTVSAGGSHTVALPIEPGALAWQLQLAWGDENPLHDLDVTVRDAAGNELARGASLNGLGLFGRAEGLGLLGGLPGGVEAEVFFKEGVAVGDQPFHLRHESATASLTAYGDLAGLSAQDLAAVTEAVSRGAMVGRGDSFDADANLTRGELARALALAGSVPQRIPAGRTFQDVPRGDSLFPYVESVAGTKAPFEVMAPHNTRRFQPDSTVRRLDFAVAIVRASGLADEAEAREGEALGLDDDDRIPFRYRGYVAVALERGLIDALPDGTKTVFDGKGRISRLESARYLIELLNLRAARSGSDSASAKTAAARPAVRRIPAVGSRTVDAPGNRLRRAN